MGKTPDVSSLENIPGPSGYSVVAPFAADITTSSTGSVHYSESFSSESFSSTVMNEVNAHINYETGADFYGTWMMVAEWNNVPLHDGSRVSLIKLNMIYLSALLLTYIHVMRIKIITP